MTDDLKERLKALDKNLSDTIAQLEYEQERNNKLQYISIGAYCVIIVMLAVIFYLAYKIYLGSVC